MLWAGGKHGAALIVNHHGWVRVAGMSTVYAAEASGVIVCGVCVCVCAVVRTQWNVP